MNVPSSTGPGRLDGRVALVTGAGSADGIGFACARHLGALGAAVAVAGLSRRVHNRAAELRDAGRFGPVDPEDVPPFSWVLTDPPSLPQPREPVREEAPAAGWRGRAVSVALAVLVVFALGLGVGVLVKPSSTPQATRKKSPKPTSTWATPASNSSSP